MRFPPISRLEDLFSSMDKMIFIFRVGFLYDQYTPLLPLLAMILAVDATKSPTVTSKSSFLARITAAFISFLPKDTLGVSPRQYIFASYFLKLHLIFIHDCFFLSLTDLKRILGMLVDSATSDGCYYFEYWELLFGDDCTCNNFPLSQNFKTRN